VPRFVAGTPAAPVAIDAIDAPARSLAMASVARRERVHVEGMVWRGMTGSEERAHATRGRGAAPEMWGGVECTVNRVGDRYLDQLERCGHAQRGDDVERIAALGVHAVRYPVLWERVAPNGLEDAAWAWPDARLRRLGECGVEPIVGLVHHGSGPPGTSLLDDGFPEALARYARAVAERYPWVRRWTPINEPLTTARFSALYGHWYPHRRDDRAFVRALLNQCRGIALAMREIRRVRPDAQLVQTEDLGVVHAMPALAEQAAFENERRWLTFDLLCGRVDRHHPLWRYLRDSGADVAAALDRLRDERCPPDVVGLNYYLTSERFLDDRLDRYPPALHGGNGRCAYVDVEAVRVREAPIGGAAGALRSAWARYGLPLAITEAHLGCTREQQLRWLHEVWTSALAVRDEGADVRAVTAWSLFGAFDWHTLVTRDDGVYEPGAFDVRAPRPRPTALAAMVRDLAARGAHEHPVLAESGWWRRDERLLYPPVVLCGEREAWTPTAVAAGPPLLVVGGAGRLGSALARACEQRHLACRVVRRDELDAADADAVACALDALSPWAVVNAAGFARVDDAEHEPGACERDTAVAAATLADACARRGLPMLTFSSDLVFDGGKSAPYVESDAPRPLGVHGRCMAAAERAALERLSAALVVRTAACFGPSDARGFVADVLAALDGGQPLDAADDLVVSPTYLPDLANAALDLLIDGERGVWHLANAGAVSWAELARRVARAAGHDPALVDALVRARPARELPFVAPRPRWSALGSERGTLLPSLDDALARFAAALPARAFV
jgi:dTDP-4-dehydrorhamnose reductase